MVTRVSLAIESRGGGSPAFREAATPYTVIEVRKLGEED